MEHGRKFNINLSTTKTKLLMLCPKSQLNWAPYNPIKIQNDQIYFEEQAEHVGVIRSTVGNMTNLFNRISAFKRALGSVISCGLARGKMSNPVASLRILSCYGTPVLMSGLASLVLSAKEISCMDQQYKRTLQNILKLSVNSPAPLVYFTAGSLPGTALLHMRQITLFLVIHLTPMPSMSF